MKVKVVQRLLAGTLALVLVAGIVTPAYASLIGDTVHIEVIGGLACIFDVVVIDPGVEVPDCGGASIDLDGDSIWFMSVDPFNNGDFIVPITYEFTDLNWTDDPAGVITGVTIINPLTIPLGPVVFDDHSISLSNPSFVLDCGGPPTCLVEWHLDLMHSGVAVGGEYFTLDTTALLLAGVQTNALWLIPAFAGAASIGIVLVRKKN